MNDVLQISEDAGGTWREFEPVHKFSIHNTPPGGLNNDGTQRPAAVWLEAEIDPCQDWFLEKVMARIRKADGGFFPDTPIFGEYRNGPRNVVGQGARSVIYVIQFEE